MFIDVKGKKIMVEANTTAGFSKTCYYEILDVDRKADTKTIRKVSIITITCSFLILILPFRLTIKHH